MNLELYLDLASDCVAHLHVVSTLKRHQFVDWQQPPLTPTMAAPEASEKQLLGLPPELRNIILRHLLVRMDCRGDPVTLTCKKMTIVGRSLLRAAEINHQLYAEMIPTFYGNNIFRLLGFFSQKTTGSDDIRRRYNDFAQPNTVVYGRIETTDPERPVQCGMQLPPLRVRKYIKHLELELVVPGSQIKHDNVLNAWYGGHFSDPGLDWLRPLDLKSLGFGHQLDQLTVQINYSPRIRRASPWVLGFIPGDNDALAQELEDLVKAQMAGMSINAVNTVVIFKQFPLPC